MGKKRNGHYCVVCASVLPNEKFSGKGHSRHICKKCSKKSSEEQDEQIKINKIYGMTRFMNLSKNNKKQLDKYLNDDSKRVREAAKSVIEEFEELKRIRKEDDQLVEKIASMTEEEYEEYFDEFDEDEAYQDDFFSDDLPF
jgi:hypothetical protein